ncbi:MAG: hypothetical protein BRD26_06820 [Bacteroidetes bacterium QH_1_64_81]|nr:MAG: hypothetical protein BRD26_06820 [Bacteroidetes bacterium QH_1_64_81]
MSESGEPVLSSSFTLEGRTLWFGTIELHQEEVVISGWTWTGPVTERIDIEEIKLHRANGKRPVFGRIHKEAKFWELAFEKDDRVDLTLRH